MSSSRVRKLRRVNQGETRFSVVFIGIALFIAGFVVTVITLSDDAGNARESGSINPVTTNAKSSHGLSELVMISGSAISLSGIVVAMMGPLASAAGGRKLD